MGKVVRKKDEQDSLLSRRVCGTCNHWERYGDEHQAPGEDIVGECVLHPPKVLDVDEMGDVIQASPVRNFRERCGQHCPKVN